MLTVIVWLWILLAKHVQPSQNPRYDKCQPSMVWNIGEVRVYLTSLLGGGRVVWRPSFPFLVYNSLYFAIIIS